MTGLLDGKAVLIVGASTGIGEDAARVFAAEGARLSLSARNAGALEVLAAELRGTGAEVVVVPGDVTSSVDVAQMVDGTVAAFGRLDGAFNNAGIGQVGLLHEVSEDDFDRVMEVNVKGLWRCLREELRVMRAQGFGAIVNTSSVGGFKGAPGLGVYQASKHAVIGLTRSAAHENGPLGIRVNAVAPGPTRTAMIEAMLAQDPRAMDKRLAVMPLGKIASGAEVAHAAAWLLSDRASQSTGMVLPVEGGMTA